jgi:hypothetical protein
MNQPSTILPSTAQYRGLVDVDLPAGRRDTEEIRPVRSGHTKEQPDLVAFGDDVFDDVEAIGNRRSQVGPGARVALAFGVPREVLHARARAAVARCEEPVDHRFAALLALRVLEPQRDGFVSLELRARHAAHALVRCAARRERACGERAHAHCEPPATDVVTFKGHGSSRLRDETMMPD